MGRSKSEKNKREQKKRRWRRDKKKNPDTNDEESQTDAYNQSNSPAPNMGRYGPPPNMEGYGPSPNMGRYGPPPNMEGYGPSPNMGRYGPPPNMEGYGYGPSPNMVGYGPPPNMEGYGYGPFSNIRGCDPPPNMERCGYSPPNMGCNCSCPSVGGLGGFPTTGGQGRKCKTCNDIDGGYGPTPNIRCNGPCPSVGGLGGLSTTGGQGRKCKTCNDIDGGYDVLHEYSTVGTMQTVSNDGLVHNSSKLVIHDDAGESQMSCRLNLTIVNKGQFGQTSCDNKSSNEYFIRYIENMHHFYEQQLTFLQKQNEMYFNLLQNVFEAEPQPQQPMFSPMCYPQEFQTPPRRKCCNIPADNVKRRKSVKKKNKTKIPKHSQGQTPSGEVFDETINGTRIVVNNDISPVSSAETSTAESSDSSSGCGMGGKSVMNFNFTKSDTNPNGGQQPSTRPNDVAQQKRLNLNITINGAALTSVPPTVYKVVPPTTQQPSKNQSQLKISTTQENESQTEGKKKKKMTSCFR